MTLSLNKVVDYEKFQFCEKRIVSNPKGINRKSWCLLFCSLMLREDVKKKLNMTDKVKYES